jgi:hypothetical protein
VSSWLEGAKDEGGLLIPADPAKHGCDLILRSGQVEVHAGDDAGAALAWEQYESRHRPLDEARDRWRFDAWAANDSTSGRWTPPGTGVGIEADGSCRVALLEVAAARQTRRNRFNRSMAKGFAVPLAPWSRQSPALARDWGLVDLLCVVLAQRPDARARLDDPARVTALARDLQGEPREVLEIPVLARSATVEVAEALVRTGLGHPLGGRPVPGDPLRPAGEVVEGLIAEGVSADREDVARVVEERYTSVDPWPFEAVTRS